jgi:hypothetical protein
MNPISMLQEFLVSRKPTQWPLPSYTTTSAGEQYWQAEATLTVPDITEPLTAKGHDSSKQRAKAKAAQGLLEQLEERGFHTTGPGSGPNPYQKQLDSLLAYERTGAYVSVVYLPKRVGGYDHVPLWETEVRLSHFADFSGSCLMSKVVTSSGSKAGAQEAAAKAVVEDPELEKVLEEVRQGGLASITPLLQLAGNSPMVVQNVEGGKGPLTPRQEAGDGAAKPASKKRKLA